MLNRIWKVLSIQKVCTGLKQRHANLIEVIIWIKEPKQSVVLQRIFWLWKLQKMIWHKSNVLQHIIYILFYLWNSLLLSACLIQRQSLLHEKRKLNQDVFTGHHRQLRVSYKVCQRTYRRVCRRVYRQVYHRVCPTSLRGRNSTRLKWNNRWNIRYLYCCWICSVCWHNSPPGVCEKPLAVVQTVMFRSTCSIAPGQSCLVHHT